MFERPPRCSDTSGSSGPHLAGTHKGLPGRSTGGQPSGVGTLLVVVAQVAVEVPHQTTQLGHQAAGEGWSPALFEDRALDPFHGTIGGGSTRSDEGLDRTEGADRVPE